MIGTISKLWKLRLKFILKFESKIILCYNLCYVKFMLKFPQIEITNLTFQLNN